MKVFQLFLALIFTLPAIAQDEVYVDFVDDEWSEVVARATKEKKYIMVDAYTDWCYWCKVMDKNTFRDPDVVAFMNEHFVSTKINCEKGTGADFNMKFRISGFPTLLFFNPAGQVVGRQVGYEDDNAEFIAILKSMLEVEEDQPYAYDGNEWYPGFPEFYKKSFRKDDHQPERIEEDVATAFLDEQENLYGEVAFSVMSRSPLSDKYVDHYVENYEKYAEMYGQQEADGVLTSAVFSKGRSAVEARDYDALLAALALLEPLEDEQQAYMELSFKGQYFQITEDWENYFEVYHDYFKGKEIGEIAGMVNSMSWNLYQHCEDGKLLKKACDMMEAVVKEDPKYAYMDTFAALCYKNGKIEMGHEWAMKAIEKAKENGEDYSGTEELIDKYEGGEG